MKERSERLNDLDKLLINLEEQVQLYQQQTEKIVRDEIENLVFELEDYFSPEITHSFFSRYTIESHQGYLQAKSLLN